MANRVERRIAPSLRTVNPLTYTNIYLTIYIFWIRCLTIQTIYYLLARDSVQKPSILFFLFSSYNFSFQRVSKRNSLFLRLGKRNSLFLLLSKRNSLFLCRGKSNSLFLRLCFVTQQSALDGIVLDNRTV